MADPIVAQARAAIRNGLEPRSTEEAEAMIALADVIESRTGKGANSFLVISMAACCAIFIYLAVRENFSWVIGALVAAGTAVAGQKANRLAYSRAEAARLRANDYLATE